MSGKTQLGLCEDWEPGSMARAEGVQGRLVGVSQRGDRHMSLEFVGRAVGSLWGAVCRAMQRSPH